MRAGQFLCERDDDAAGAGTDVRDRPAVAVVFSRTAGTQFAHCEAVEGHFDDMFGFRARNKDIGGHLKFEAPELLLAGEVLRGNARSAEVQERLKGSRLSFGEFGFRDRKSTRLNSSHP